jgi:hypothetical protein
VAHCSHFSGQSQCTLPETAWQDFTTQPSFARRPTQIGKSRLNSQAFFVYIIAPGTGQS